jgi:hypothetical protein
MLFVPRVRARDTEFLPSPTRLAIAFRTVPFAASARVAATANPALTVTACLTEQTE